MYKTHTNRIQSVLWLLVGGIGACWGILNQYIHGRWLTLSYREIGILWLLLGMLIALGMYVITRRPVLSGLAVAVIWTLALIARFGWYLVILARGDGHQLPALPFNGSTRAFLLNTVQMSGTHWVVLMLFGCLGSLLTGWAVAYGVRGAQRLIAPGHEPRG